MYLLRHAKSSWDEPGRPDRERPLAPRGVRDAKRVAKHLRRQGVAPELVLCSPAVRTRETLELVLPALAAKFPTAALATLALPSWRLSPGDGELVDYVVPKGLL